MQMKKNRLKVHVAIEARAKNNQSDSTKNVFKNNIMKNIIIEDEDLLKNLIILNDEY